MRATNTQVENCEADRALRARASGHPRVGPPLSRPLAPSASCMRRDCTAGTGAPRRVPRLQRRGQDQHLRWDGDVWVHEATGYELREQMLFQCPGIRSGPMKQKVHNTVIHV
jgi:hypothetical protein